MSWFSFFWRPTVDSISTELESLSNESHNMKEKQSWLWGCVTVKTQKESLRKKFDSVCQKIQYIKDEDLFSANNILIGRLFKIKFKLSDQTIEKVSRVATHWFRLFTPRSIDLSVVADRLLPRQNIRFSNYSNDQLKLYCITKIFKDRL